MAAASRRCCRGLPLKYHIRYGRSRHRLRFRYPVSNTMVGTLLCFPLLLCGKRRRRNQIRHFRYAEWDTVNVLPPIMPDLVQPRLYFRLPRHPAYLISYLSSIALIIPHLIFFPHRLALLLLSWPTHVSTAISTAVLIHRLCHLTCLILLPSSTCVLPPTFIIRCPSHTILYLCLPSSLLFYISACISDVCCSSSRSRVSAAGALPSCAPRSVPTAFLTGRGILRLDLSGGVWRLPFLIGEYNSPLIVSIPSNVPGFWVRAPETPCNRMRSG